MIRIEKGVLKYGFGPKAKERIKAHLAKGLPLFIDNGAFVVFQYNKKTKQN